MPSKGKILVDPRILEAAGKIVAKRPKTVIDHIIQHGFITTEELKDIYGYDHPPRAARDVREAGIPLETFWITGKSNRKIGAYRFADPSGISQHKLGGRRTFSKPFKQLLLLRDGSRCSICSEIYEDRYLTIDHRIPYEVVGDNPSDEHQAAAFMLVCGTCQRKKSWSCEHCSNWIDAKNISICKTCYWSSPESYVHLAMKAERRIELVWTEGEVSDFERLKAEAAIIGLSLQENLKKKLQS